MPFKSEKQRRYMWARHPEIARRWEEEAKSKGEDAVQEKQHLNGKQFSKDG